MANDFSEPLAIARQGSFYVGGRQVTAAGTMDLAHATAPGNAGDTFWIDQMYVHYQVPVNPRSLSLVLVHGGGGTGAVWETTPDGREGFQTLLLRRGFSVYTVDAPRGGRSGFPSFNGDFGRLDPDQQVIPPQTLRMGARYAWVRWRMGPHYPQPFEQQAFPLAAFDSFMKGVRPMAADDPEVVADALVQLLEKIGPAVLVTHSNGGLWGWLTGARSPHVRGVVSYEPTVVPTADEAVGDLEKVPVQVVFGDNIPASPAPIPAADARRLQRDAAKQFVDALNQRGGQANALLLPDAGLRGNSHFMFQDLNNVEVADELSAFLAKYGLDGR